MIRSCTQQVNAMPDTLPPLKALRAFVAAARHESFLEAGEELNVSPGAISRHVKTLEGFLNSSLFLRHSNGVELTGSGQIYQAKTEPILMALSEVTRSFLAETEDEVLVISTLPIFAEKWLGPHLPAFRKLHPRIRLRIDNRDGIDAKFRRDTEAKIVYTDHPPENVQATYLFGESLVPVCGPAIREALSENPLPKKILCQTRLRDTFWGDDWTNWAKAFGHDNDLPPPELSFALYNLVIQSAKSNMGIAIGHTAMIRQELENRELFALEEYAIRSPASYYLIAPRNRPESYNLATFRNWISDQSKKDS